MPTTSSSDACGSWAISAATEASRTASRASPDVRSSIGASATVLGDEFDAANLERGWAEASGLGLDRRPLQLEALSQQRQRRCRRLEPGGPVGGQACLGWLRAGLRCRVATFELGELAR